MTSSELISPFGGQLVDLLVPAEAAEATRLYAGRLPSIQISERSACDLELLATGAFSPLDRFVAQADYERILAEMRLANGLLFPIPVQLPVDPDPALHLGADIALRSAKNEILAVLTIEEIYEWDRAETAR